MADPTINPPAASPAPPAAPAAPTFKIGSTALLAEETGRDKKIVQYTLLITETGTADEVIKDSTGGIVFIDKEFPVGDGKTVKRRVASTQKVNTYGGFAFNASQATPSVRRNVPASSLSPLS